MYKCITSHPFHILSHRGSSMKSLKHYTIAGIFFVLITGTFAHFLYEWSGDNAIVGLFTPVNESIWEHMKLLFFPMLIYAAFMFFRLKDEYPCIASSLCSGLLTGTLLIPILFYTYTGLLGKDLFILDIGIFIVSTLCAFLVSYRLALSCKGKPQTIFLCVLTGIFLIAFLLFTYHPPELFLFAEPL